jgi:hypothetical protein
VAVNPGGLHVVFHDPRVGCRRQQMRPRGECVRES